MFRYSSVAVVTLSALLISGCASTAPESSDPDFSRTYRRVLVRIPEGLAGEKYWNRARQWIVRHSLYSGNGEGTSTYAPGGQTVYGFSITPVRMHTLGGASEPEPTTGAAGIELRLDCGTFLSQCVPKPDEVIRAFTEYVRTGNDRFRFHKQEWVSIR